MIVICLLSSAVFTVSLKTQWTGGYEPELTKGENSIVWQLQMVNYLDTPKTTVSRIKKKVKNWVKIGILLLHSLTYSLISTTYVALPPIGSSSHNNDCKY